MNNNIIGRAERVDFPDLGIKKVPAKIDTGADASSIWASSVKLKGDNLLCIFLGPESPYYTGETIKFSNDNYSFTRVSSSFGHKEVRYKVKLRVKVNGKLINATFTLSNRASKTYPILIGRRLLSGKFLVDVSEGKPLIAEEKRKRKIMQQELRKLGYSAK